MNNQNKTISWWKHESNFTDRLRKVEREHGIEMAWYCVRLVDIIARTPGNFIKSSAQSIAYNLSVDYNVAAKILLAIDDCPQDILCKVPITDAIEQDFEYILTAGEIIINSRIVDECREQMEIQSRRNRENVQKRWNKEKRENNNQKQ